jgi:hypothetical protein
VGSIPTTTLSVARVQPNSRKNPPTRLQNLTLG